MSSALRSLPKPATPASRHRSRSSEDAPTFLSDEVVVRVMRPSCYPGHGLYPAADGRLQL